MTLFFRKGFTKSYAKLSAGEKFLVNRALEAFEEDPFHPDLKTMLSKAS